MAQQVVSITVNVSRPWVYVWAFLKICFNRDVKWLFRRAVRVA